MTLNISLKTYGITRKINIIGHEHLANQGKNDKCSKLLG